MLRLHFSLPKATYRADVFVNISTKQGISTKRYWRNLVGASIGRPIPTKQAVFTIKATAKEKRLDAQGLHIKNIHRRETMAKGRKSLNDEPIDYLEEIKEIQEIEEN